MITPYEPTMFPVMLSKVSTEVKDKQAENSNENGPTTLLSSISTVTIGRNLNYTAYLQISSAV